MNLEDVDCKTWQRRMADAKKRHRPRLRTWTKDGFAIEPTRIAAFEMLRTLPSGVVDVTPDVSVETHPNAIQRCRYEDLTYESFAEKYERPGLPVVISGIPQAEAWPALQRWTKEGLRPLKHRLFKCGEDDDGRKVRVKLRHFLRYTQENQDDSPLYIFDANFDSDPQARSLLDDFTVSERYFPDDLFSLVGEQRRPPYRWWLVGPQRSGTCVHIDPLGTSAWNTVVSGRKRWALFPPGTPKHIARATETLRKSEDDEAVNYFADMLPRLKAMHPSLPLVEFTQMPGDTVFVPGGWWHAVLNLDHTFAITQNFCSRNNFGHVWRKTRASRRKMAIKWLGLLRDTHPELADTAERLNAEDGFDMSVSSRAKKKRSSDGSKSGMGG